MAGFGSVLIGAHMPLWSIVFSHMVALLYEEDPEKQRAGSLIIFLVFVALGVLFLFAAVMQHVGLGRVAEQLAAGLRKKAFASILRQEAGFFDLLTSHPFTLSQQLVYGADEVKHATAKPRGFLLQAASALTVGLLISYMYGCELALVGSIAIPLLVASAMWQYHYILVSSSQEKQAYEIAGAIAANALRYIRTVQAYCAQDDILREYQLHMDKTLVLGYKRALVSGACLGGFFLIINFAYALCFWYGNKLMAQGTIVFDDMIIVTFAIIIAAIDVGQSLAKILPGIGKAAVAQAGLLALVNRPPAIEEPSVEDAVAWNQSATGSSMSFDVSAVEFQNVRLTYPTRPNAFALNGFSMTVRKGETVALVGSSGSGKSSVLNVLTRLYTHQHGSILVDGRDTRNIPIWTLRSKIGIVAQDPYLFDGTLAENIAYGSELVLFRDDVLAAGRIAGVDEFAKDLEHGYDTVIGSCGVSLSGGQAQRLSIARALAKEPRLLLLDEYTSSLDATSESLVQASLDVCRRANPDRATIIIAHRLSTVQQADKIAVMDKGQIIQWGSHDELIADTEGKYAKLVEASLT